MREYSLTPITPAIGAEISGIDLSLALSQAQSDQIYQDFATNSSPLNTSRRKKRFERN